MTRHIAIFVACFLLGGLLTAVLRTATHEPYASVAPDPAPAAPAEPAPAAPPVAATPSGPPVNTVCAICAMPVDPKIPTAVYKGKVIGFGCRMCPPKFAKEPDRYGPAYLENRVAE